MSTYTKTELNKLNCNRKYGPNWIITDLSLKHTDNNFKLYSTGDATISAGRIYIALPANKVLTDSDKQKYNIMD